MATLLETVQRFRKIEEATAPKDDPAPVYLLDEIAELARQSPESAQAIAEAVQKKLGVKSPVVKFKALRVIKHLCIKGCSQFQRCMQRHSTCVRELIHFRGEPDPFKGDVPNARVREFAKEVVEVLFNSTPVTNTTSTLAAQGKIQGFGSSGPSESSSTYGGMGSNSGPYGSGLRSAGGSGSMGLPTSFAAAQQAASQLTQAATQALGEGPIAQGIANAANALGGFLQPAGYGSRLNDSGYQEGNDNGFGYSNSSSYSAPAVSQVAPGQALGSEEGIVDDICAPGGLRALPDAADLRRFVDTASSMDGLRIAELLREKMESDRWQVVLRSLAALEAVLQRGSTQACGEVAVMFQSDPEPIRVCLKSSQQQVQAKAASVLKLLLGEEVQIPAVSTGSSSSKATSKAAAAAAAPVVDLLSLDDGPAETAAAAAPASAAATAGIDLLADLAGPNPAAAAATAGGNSLFDGLGVAGAPPAAAAANGDDMFGGLTVAAPAAPTAAPATAGKQAAPLNDLLSGLTVSNSTAAAPASHVPNATASLLGISPVKQQPQQQQQQNLLGESPVKQQPQQQPNLLGGSPVKQQQQPLMFGDFGQQGYGLQQVNTIQQPQQQQFGIPGLGVPGVQQAAQQQQWAALGHAGSGLPVMASGAVQQQHGGLYSSGSGSGTAGASAWKGHDDVSNLMRQVAHGGKYDPAFDFVADEFKKH